MAILASGGVEVYSRESENCSDETFSFRFTKDRRAAYRS